MAKDRKELDTSFADDNASGWIARFLAEEDEFDRRLMWRVGSWAAASVAALVIAIVATQQAGGLRRERAAFAELAKHSQQVQWVAKESQDETRRLAAAVDTLNGDRDRLYSRVTTLEQGLDSVTGSVARVSAAAIPAQWPLSPPAPVVAATGSAPASLTSVSGLMEIARAANGHAASHEPSPPTVAGALPPVPSGKFTDAKAEAKLEHKPAAKAEAATSDESPATTAAISTTPETHEAIPLRPVLRTEFGVDLGGAASVEGLRALWRGAIKSHDALLTPLQPIIVIRERHDGLGLQLRLVAGPFANAAAAAKICAQLAESKRGCETAIYDGQRLAMTAEKPAPARHVKRKPRRAAAEPAAAAPEPPKSRSFTSFLGR
jgi:hypothetical protein